MLIDVHAYQYPDAYLDAVRHPTSGLEHYIRDDGRLVVLQDGAVALAVPRNLSPRSNNVSASWTHDAALVEHVTAARLLGLDTTV